MKLRGALVSYNTLTCDIVSSLSLIIPTIEHSYTIRAVVDKHSSYDEDNSLTIVYDIAVDAYLNT